MGSAQHAWIFYPSEFLDVYHMLDSTTYSRAVGKFVESVVPDPCAAPVHDTVLIVDGVLYWLPLSDNMSSTSSVQFLHCHFTVK